MQIEWIKCDGDVWCDFLYLNLRNEHFDDLNGVYIIFLIYPKIITVRVGSGNIRERLNDHRNNNEILEYQNLKVTWARVNANQMEGVEKFLADTLDPLIGERFPDRTPIPVNLPWE